MALFLSEWCNLLHSDKPTCRHADSAVCRVGHPRSKKLHGQIVHVISNSMVFINTVMCAAKLIWRRTCPAAGLRWKLGWENLPKYFPSPVSIATTCDHAIMDTSGRRDRLTLGWAQCHRWKFHGSTGSSIRENCLRSTIPNRRSETRLFGDIAVSKKIFFDLRLSAHSFYTGAHSGVTNVTQHASDCVRDLMLLTPSDATLGDRQIYRIFIEYPVYRQCTIAPVPFEIQNETYGRICSCWACIPPKSCTVCKFRCSGPTCFSRSPVSQFPVLPSDKDSVLSDGPIHAPSIPIFSDGPRLIRGGKVE